VAEEKKGLLASIDMGPAPDVDAEVWAPAAAEASREGDGIPEDQEIDFVTLGMFIIGKSAYNLSDHFSLRLRKRIRTLIFVANISTIYNIHPIRVRTNTAD
jgi:hypothetical protein